MNSRIRLPGLIDIHVHLRDPGQTHKEDFYSGTLAALAGGITTIFDMPNKSLHVLSESELEIKEETARQKAVCDYGFYFGTDGKNYNEFERVSKQVVGLKVFLDASTGHTLMSASELELIMRSWPKTKLIVFHVEDDKVQQVIELSAQLGNKIHITHVHTKKLLASVLEAKKKGLSITCDVTPHHLFLTENDVKRLKGFGIMRPPLVTKEDQDFLWEHIQDIDCIATDHAPHTIEEKKSDNPPTGVPGLETMLPLLLTAVSQEKITINDIVRLTSGNPQRIFGVRPDLETFIEVDLQKKYFVDNKKLKTKCGWSPFHGMEMRGSVEAVTIRGTKVYENENILVKPGFGKPLIIS